MKKVFALMSIVGLLTFANFNDVKAQDAPNAEGTEQIEATDEAVAEEAVVATEDETVAAPADDTKSFHQML